MSKKNEVATAKPRNLTKTNTWNNNMYDFKPGDNSKNLNFLLQINQLPKIDLFNAEEVKARTWEYFRLCEQADMRPLVSGYAAALGLDRRRLYEIRTGNFHRNYNTWKDLPQETLDMIHQAYDFLEQLWETNMIQGKVNPVTGIFLGKNNFGYKDNVDYTISPGQQENNPDEIMRRYQIEHDENEKET